MATTKTTISVSILSANFLRLEDELKKIEDAGINWIHFDVMDRHFVPNITFGPKILQSICNYSSNLNIECHLMVKVTTPTVKEYLNSFLILPQVKIITFHIEALSVKQLEEFVNLKASPFKKGLAINPDTNIKTLFPYLPLIDHVLIMGVSPGFGGQKFLDITTSRIKKIAAQVKSINANITVGVDGGINEKTGAASVKAGATYLVAGSYLINSKNMKEQVKTLEKWIET